MPLRFWSSWGFVAGYQLSIAKFKDLKFIYKEGRQSKYFIFNEICMWGHKNMKKVIWMFLILFTFHQTPREKRTLEQMLLLFSAF